MGNKIDKKAADSIFLEYMKNNPVVPKDKPISHKKRGSAPSIRSIDLHGMTADNAVAATERFIRTIRSSGEKRAVIITGKGSHSEGIRSPIKDAVGEYLRDNAAALRIDVFEREGSLEIWIKS